VVKDSGARYLSLDGVLHPVLNLASAKLLAGDQLTVRNVNAKSIKQAPRGASIGLIGAPDALPASTALTSGPWRACATQQLDDTGAITAKLTLAIGLTPAGQQLGATAAAPVAGPDGNDYLLWNGQRLRMDRANNVVQAVGYAGADLPPVSAAFLDAVPAGPDLAVPKTPAAGSPGPVLAGQPSRLGQLFSDSSENRYLLTRQGLVALTPTLYALYNADPRTQSTAYAGGNITLRSLGPSDLTAHLAAPAASAALTHNGGLPVALPAIVHLSSRQAVCEQIHPGAGFATSLAVMDASAVAAADQSAPDAEPGVSASCLPVDEISVQPGAGVLVNAALAAGAPGAAYYLVTDGGVKYPIPSADVLGTLGYGSATATMLPVNWLSLLPTGPALDPAAVIAGGMASAAPDSACAGPAGAGSSRGPGTFGRRGQTSGSASPNNQAI